LPGSVGSEGRSRISAGGWSRDEDFSDHDCLPPARDAEAEPDTECSEEDSDEGAVELDRVLNDYEAVFSVLEGGDEEAADQTEDEDVALHDGSLKEYSGDGEEAVSLGGRRKSRGAMAWPFQEARLDSPYLRKRVKSALAIPMEKQRIGLLHRREQHARDVDVGRAACGPYDHVGNILCR